MDTEPHVVEITDRGHAAQVNRWIGQIEALTALEDKAKEFERLPGFGLALAILQKEVAESRSKAVAENLRAIARAGIDVVAVRNVGLETGKNGLLRLTATMMDLADLAEMGGS
ncbi:hypothetical protein [Mesorhizobium sp. M0058]|uniref:hypothetical protein n=1 Tax=Mesorhizobium sp. M0058 TaxID=2956865 RepID=UPI00333CA264